MLEIASLHAIYLAKTRCLIRWLDGAILSQKWKEALGMMIAGRGDTPLAMYENRDCKATFRVTRRAVSIEIYGKMEQL